MWMVTGLWLVGLFLAILLKESLLLVLPLGSMLTLLLLADYRLVLLLLFFSIPFSIEVPLVGNELMLDVPVEPLLLMLSAMVVAISLARRGLKVDFWSHPLVLIILLQLIWSIASTMGSDLPGASLKYLIQKGWFILACVGLPYLYLREPGRYKSLWATYALGLLIVLVLSTIRHGMAGFAWGDDINIHVRPFYINHVLYGCAAAMLVPIAWALLLWRRQQGEKTIFPIILLSMALLATLFSYTRASWLSLFLMLAVVLLVRTRLFVHMLAFVLVFVVVLVVWLLRDNQYLEYAPDFDKTVMHWDLDQHLEATMSGKDLSGMERIYRWVAAKRMIEERPLLGSGPDSFYPTYFSRSVETFRTYVSDNPERSTTHNYFLMLTAEQGIPALLLFLIGLLYFFYRSYRLYLRAKEPFYRTLLFAMIMLMVVFISHQFLNDLVENNKIGILYYLLIGMLVRVDIQLKMRESAYSE
jgi:O-antigen ligase